tara:strand:+ start:6843 stop:7904 length:1062 start_codon:yes stop_codon:yes gene_type:complete
VINYNSILKINTKNLLENYNFFKNRKKQLLVAATIKANCYGLGCKKIFKLLVKNNCNHFFVATIEEGINLNNKNKNINIYVLNGIQNININLFKKYNLIPIINTLKELEKIIKSDVKFGVHIDTGINRLGINYTKIPHNISQYKNLKILISHLSSADEGLNEYNNLQKKRYLKIIKKFKINQNIILSLSNTNGSILSKSFLFDMIRPGIGLYGGFNNNKKLKSKIKPVVTLSSRIIQIKTINKNEYIGYNQTYKTNKTIKIAIIGLGYADGIPRKLSNSGTVYYKNDKFKIIGRISMDSLTIDITNSKHILEVGTLIDIINDAHGIEDFAYKCNTISNEVITSIGERVKRVYE